MEKRLEEGGRFKRGGKTEEKKRGREDDKQIKGKLGRESV